MNFYTNRNKKTILNSHEACDVNHTLEYNLSSSAPPGDSTLETTGLKHSSQRRTVDLQVRSAKQHQVASREQDFT